MESPDYLSQYNHIYRTLCDKSIGNKAKEAIIDTADQNLLNHLCEICENVLRGNVPVEEGQKQALHQHRSQIYHLVDKRSKVRKRRRLLKHKAKGLGTATLFSALLIPFINYVTSLITK